MPKLIGSLCLIVAGFIVGLNYKLSESDSFASIFYPEQIVRVYSSNGGLLFSGAIKSEANPYVTICKLKPVNIGGKFAPNQCVTLDIGGPFLIIEANEPGIKWLSPMGRNI